MTILEEPPLYKLSELADILRIDPKTLCRWRQAEKIPGEIETPGGLPRFRRQEVNQWLYSLGIRFNTEDGRP